MRRFQSRVSRGHAGRMPRVLVAILAAGCLAMIALAALAASASAQSDTTAFTIPGNPLTVNVGPRGECQSSYIVGGEVAGNYYLGSNPVGDCGFFLAFPSAGTGQPPGLKGKTYGFEGLAGPGSFGGTPGSITEYEKVTQLPVTGLGTTASPFSQTTVFRVTEGIRFATVTETTTYVNGSPQFTSTYNVKNESGGKLYFRAIYAGDLYVNGNDHGTGVFLAGPPRFIGGQNTSSGVLGGFVEAPSPALPWSAFEEAYWSTPTGLEVSPTDDGIWHDIETNVDKAATFNNSIEPLELDNGAGVEWDQFYKEGLADKAEQAFTIINRTQIPSGLQINPVAQTLTQGQRAAISVRAVDTGGTPFAGKTLRYTIAGANGQTGAVVLNGNGEGQIAYTGANAGIDTVQMFVDLAGNGSQSTSDPGGAASVTWLPKPAAPPSPPAPNSSYKVQSIHANSNGTITIVFVPVQAGQATLEVTVPTGTIARKQAEAAKRKKCKKGLKRIKGKCLKPTTLSGKLTATGVAGVPLTLTVKPSKKVVAALRKHRTVTLTAKLTYRSALGGNPTSSTYVFKVKQARKRKKH